MDVSIATCKQLRGWRKRLADSGCRSDATNQIHFTEAFYIRNEDWSCSRAESTLCGIETLTKICRCIDGDQLIPVLTTSAGKSELANHEWRMIGPALHPCRGCAVAALTLL
jgi:hypothetical protein